MDGTTRLRALARRPWRPCLRRALELVFSAQADAAPRGHLPTSRSAINQKGYYQSHSSTTDGAETLHDPLIAAYYEEDADAFEDGESTGEIARSFNDERNDYLNIRKHI